MCAEAAEIMRDIGTAIQFLHGQNIAHRDVKVRSRTQPEGQGKGQSHSMSPDGSQDGGQVQSLCSLAQSALLCSSQGLSFSFKHHIISGGMRIIEC